MERRRGQERIKRHQERPILPKGEVILHCVTIFHAAYRTFSNEEVFSVSVNILYVVIWVGIHSRLRLLVLWFQSLRVWVVC